MGLNINLATGQNAQGVIQTAGDQPDANWTVTNADSYKNAPIAYTVAPGNPDWGGSWFGNGANSSWIAANPDSSANGAMTFTLRFNLSGYNPADASIVSGLFALDDVGTVSLNGHLLGSVPNGAWGGFTSFSNGAGDFVAGWNTLTIQITQSDNLDEGARLQGTIVDNVTSAPIHWANAVSGDFTTASDWSGGAVPASGDDVILDAADAKYIVSSSTDETVNSLQMATNATLSITGGTFTATNGTGSGANSGTITVSNATFTAGGMIQNAGGVIDAAAGGSVDLPGATLAGGTLETQGSGVIDAGGDSTAPGIFDGTTSALTNQGSVVVTDGLQLNLEGAIQNSGTISVEGQAGATTLDAGQGGATLSGGGGIVLSDNSNNAIAAGASGAVLTNVDNTISGAGSIGGNGMAFTNESGGTVDANGTNALTLSTTGAVSNAGLLEATGARGLFIRSTTVSNAGGTISAGDGSRVFLQAADIQGGTLASAGKGVFKVIGAGDVFDGTSSAVEIAGRVVVPTGASLTGQGNLEGSGLIVAKGAATLNGPFANTGRLEVVGGTMTVLGAVTGSGQALIAGGGTLIFRAGFDETVLFNKGGGTLVLADSQAYGSTVYRFSQAGGTALDLNDIGFVSAGEATFAGTAGGGVLTVTDGTHTAHIRLRGDFRSSTFTAASDGHGGVMVTDPTVSQLSQLIQAVAAFSTSASGLAPTHDLTPASQVAMLATPH